MGSNGILLQLMMLVGLGLGLVLATSVAAATTQSKPGCPDKCGNVTIPYPFGTKLGCYLNYSFLITCNDSLSPPKPFLRLTDWDVTSISFDGQLRILQPIGRLCSGEKGTELNSPPQDWALSRFFISNTQNKFSVIGCDTRASITGSIDGSYYSTECSLFCSKIHYENESYCSGTGCCEISIPQRLWSISVTLSNTSSAKSDGSEPNSCSYAFVVEKSLLNFSAKFVESLQTTDKLPLVLDWAIGNETCQVAGRNQSTFACKGNSTCIENDNGAGYRCRCKKGYEGNPYLNACIDIDECSSPTLNDCVKKENCFNTVGNYTCSCPKGYVGDGRSDGKGCDAKSNPLQAIQVALDLKSTITETRDSSANQQNLIDSLEHQNFFEEVAIEESKDRFSYLPNEILGHILSFLPTKYAVGTCILSTRWEYLWASLLNLDFDDELWVQNKCTQPTRFATFVDRVLTLRNVSHIQRFCLKFS